MRNAEHWFIISYDIRLPKRLQRLHRWLKRHAFALQESVFIFAGTLPAWEQLKHGIQTRIKRTEDDVRVYQLSQSSILTFYGVSPWPDDIYFAGYPPFQVLHQAMHPSMQSSENSIDPTKA